MIQCVKSLKITYSQSNTKNAMLPDKKIEPVVTFLFDLDTVNESNLILFFTRARARKGRARYSMGEC
jgi:hypothetical protein